MTGPVSDELTGAVAIVTGFTDEVMAGVPDRELGSRRSRPSTLPGGSRGPRGDAPDESSAAGSGPGAFVVEDIDAQYDVVFASTGRARLGQPLTH